MWNEVFTPKQAELISMFKHGALRHINILDGSVRSGKTFVSLVVWMLYVAAMPRSGSYLMCAKTLYALKRNCLDLLSELAGEQFTYSLSAKEGRLFGRKLYLEGACDARAEAKIRGMTLAGAYCDELTQVPEDYFSMLLSRLSVPGAKVLATTNPDSPMHWLMRNYLARKEELDLLSVKFLLEDNCFLESDYIQRLKAEYQGVFYQRFILGKWCVAEGLVYDLDGIDYLLDTLPLPEEAGRYRYYISVDYGTLNPCSMGLWAVDASQGAAYRITEYYYSGRETRRQQTDEEYYAALEALAGNRDIDAVVVDPSAASFLETIRRHGRFRARKADNAVLPGIRTVAALFRAGRLKILRGCKDTLRELSLYSWDPQAPEDRVIKAHDHAMDDMRYFARTILRKEFRWEEW